MVLFKVKVIVFCLLQFSLLDATIVPGGITVTLSVFSGRRNPHWSLASRDPNYKKITQLLAVARKGGLAYSPNAIPARLGFRGFIVQDQMTVQLIVGRETMELQQLFLKTMPKGLLRGGNLQKVLEAIKIGAVKTAAGAKRFKRYSPPYDPAPWHANQIVTLCNNCYNYATTIRSNNTAMPGSGSGQMLQQYTFQEVQAAAVRDGLEVLNPQPGANDPVPGAPGGDRHLVALVVDPDRPAQNYEGDFHWYRLDADGKWSHKQGESPVSRQDNALDEIDDPRLASMDPYQFVSFMTVNRNTVQIQDNYICDYWP